MKLIFVSSVLYFLTTLTTLAQGTVHFSNRVTAAGLSALVTERDCVTLLGSAYFAQLYAGGSAVAESSLAPVGLPVRFKNSSTTGMGLGWFDGGTVTIPNIPPGGAAVVQARYWDSAGGATYEAASNSGKWFGKTELLYLAATGNPLGEPPGIPVDLVGLRGFGFCLEPPAAYPPEPSPLALGAFGAAILWLWGRRPIARR